MEKKGDNMQSCDIQKLKRIELDMLKVFVLTCEKLGLKYYLLGGTLLGAVRHQGFIPWDDDIDVGMPREDYDRFEKEAQKYLPDYYFIQTRNTDQELLNNFMKIRDSRTTFIETSVKNQKINHGVYLDVFPLDYYPESSWEQKIFDIKNQVLKLRIRDAFTLPDKSKHAAHIEFALNIASKLLTLVYPDVKSALDKQNKLFTEATQSRILANYCGAWGKKEIMPAEWYGKGKCIEFEGIQVKAPKEYEKWLTQVYGDYLKLPPVEKRITHHFTELIDLEKPYTEYVK